MVGGGSIGPNEVPVPEGGGGVTGIFSFILYINTHYFRSLFTILKIIKWLTNPFGEGLSLFCKITEKCHQA